MADTPKTFVFAVGYVVFRRCPGECGGSIPSHGVELIIATTKAKAKAIGTRFAKFEFPTTEGWFGHSVNITDPNSFLKPEAEWTRMPSSLPPG